MCLLRECFLACLEENRWLVTLARRDNCSSTKGSRIVGEDLPKGTCLGVRFCLFFTVRGVVGRVGWEVEGVAFAVLRLVLCVAVVEEEPRRRDVFEAIGVMSKLGVASTWFVESSTIRALDVFFVHNVQVRVNPLLLIVIHVSSL